MTPGVAGIFARGLLGAVVLPWLIGCGGSTGLAEIPFDGPDGTTPPDAPPIETNDRADTDSPSTNPHATQNDTSRPDEAGFDAASDAALDHRDAASLIHSGTRLCQDPRECFSLVCELNGTKLAGACVDRCPVGDECDVGYACMAFASTPASCFVTCKSPTNCAFGYDCVDYFGNGKYACLPIPWVAGLP